MSTARAEGLLALFAGLIGIGRERGREGIDPTRMRLRALPLGRKVGVVGNRRAVRRVATTRRVAAGRGR
jgi:hypothetical protein